jgi:hypothetical protein
MEILAPISIGELYDKISILQIKLENINDHEKRLNILKEYHLLIDIFSKLEKKDLDKLDQLKKVNQSLWEVEDKLRIMERTGKWCLDGEFYAEFVTLARQVYFDNDERSRIKKDINLFYNSEIVEEKSYEKY